MPMRARFVSRNSLAAVLMPNLLLIAAWPVLASAEAERAAEQRSSPSPAAADRRTDAQAWFAKGQTALQAGDLEGAEEDFRRGLGAYPGQGPPESMIVGSALTRQECEPYNSRRHSSVMCEPYTARHKLHYWTH